MVGTLNLHSFHTVLTDVLCDVDHRGKTLPVPEDKDVPVE